MVMISSCFFGFALLGSMVYTMMKNNDSAVFQAFMNTLNEEQKHIYMEIKKERLQLYLQGLVLGCVLAMMSLFLLSSKSPLTRICVFSVLGLGSAYVYYSLMPKKKWMLDYIETNEQSKAWLDIYQEMKRRSIVGGLLGISGFVLLGSGVCM